MPLDIVALDILVLDNLGVRDSVVKHCGVRNNSAGLSGGLV